MPKYEIKAKDAKPGMVFGKLTLISLFSPPSFGVHAKWKCKCECGQETVVGFGNLKSGHTESCGCLLKSKIKTMNKTHGFCGTSTYRSWQGMKRRCNENQLLNSGNPSKYLEKGIKFCERWEKFENFLEDMGERPGREYSLDRIDNNGDYCPENCKWSTFKEQAVNKDNNVRWFFNGQEKTVTEWAEELGVPNSLLYARVDKLGWSVEKTLSTPHKKNKYKRKFGKTLTFNGETLTIKEWSQRTGLEAGVIRARRNKGLPIEKILGENPRKRK